MSVTTPGWSTIPETVQSRVKRYLSQLKKGLGSQLEAVLLYGSVARGEYVEGHSNINLLLMLQTYSLKNLQHCGTLHQKWQNHEIVPPLVLTALELRRSFSLFPLEYVEIMENHLVLQGGNPFLGLDIDDQNLFDHCHKELYGNLVRTRQCFIEGHGRPEAIRAVLALSLTALLPSLRGVFRVLGYPTRGTSQETITSLNNLLQVNDSVFLEVLEMKQGLRTPGIKALPDLFYRYVQSLEALIEQSEQKYKQKECDR